MHEIQNYLLLHLGGFLRIGYRCVSSMSVYTGELPLELLLERYNLQHHALISDDEMSTYNYFCSLPLLLASPSPIHKLLKASGQSSNFDSSVSESEEEGPDYSGIESLISGTNFEEVSSHELV